MTRCVAATVAVALGAVLPRPAATQEPGATRTVAFTTTEGTWMSLEASPDGRTLLVELLGDIYAMPVEGGRATRLLTGAAFQSQPRLSPDGMRLAFISDESGSDNVWMADADGRNARPLSRRPRSGMLSPAWLADGRAVFVPVTDPYTARTAELWRFDAVTGDGTRLLENTNGPPQPLVSSPPPGPYGPGPTRDGASVWFTSVTPRPYGSRNGPSSSLMRVSAWGGAAEAVLVEGTPAMKPMLSPDGRTLVYGTVREGRTGWKARDLATGAERWLAYPVDRHQLEARASRDVLPNAAFSPDGRWLYAAFAGKVHRLGVADGPSAFARRVADPATRGVPSPAVSAAMSRAGVVTFSPTRPAPGCPRDPSGAHWHACSARTPRDL